VREFVAAIRGGNWSAYSGREGLQRAQIIDACYQSALGGREVALGVTEQQGSNVKML
jgi:predicted dehydrogenase